MRPTDSGANSVNNDGVMSRSPNPAQPAHLSVIVAVCVTPPTSKESVSLAEVEIHIANLVLTADGDGPVADGVGVRVAGGGLAASRGWC